MPYQIEVSAWISAAHRLRGYRGRCENLHGHNWKVSAVFEAGELDQAGLALDFAEARRLLAAVLEPLDHACLNELPFFREHNPTSEQMARYVFDALVARSLPPGVRPASVSVWESENCRARYAPAS